MMNKNQVPMSNNYYRHNRTSLCVIIDPREAAQAKACGSGWSPSSRSTLHRFTRCILLLILPMLAGCGTDFSQLLLQSSATVGQTAIDLLLTDLTNQLADAIDQAVNSPDTGGDDGDDHGGDPGGDDGDDHGGDPGGDTNLDHLTGDPAIGSTLYISNGCGGCHCADAVGDCALSAPPLIGGTLDILDAHLRGSFDHPVKVAMTDQEIVDLQAWLSSL